MKPKISVVIPTRNRPVQLKRLIRSINTSTYPSKLIEIIIVNNGDPLEKGIVATEIIQNPTNKGLAFARNQGAHVAHGAFVLFVDDDNVLDKECISRLVETFLGRSEYVVLGPKTFYLSQPQKLWFAGAKMNLWTSIPYFYKEADLARAWDGVLTVENLHNCLMIDRKCGESVGWFDEKIFMNGTEFDLIRRLKKKFTTSK
ncbi:MAG TPA: glycosyltransferase [Patescibacteria group bacterium]|nr:glycosyltransferase [Patescibacteria group bacterium]